MRREYRHWCVVRDGFGASLGAERCGFGALLGMALVHHWGQL